MQGQQRTELSILRHIALTLLNQEQILRQGTKNKRLEAGWNTRHLCKAPEA